MQRPHLRASEPDHASDKGLPLSPVPDGPVPGGPVSDGMAQPMTVEHVDDGAELGRWDLAGAAVAVSD
ncbi:hypothetical protein SAMN05428953_12252 [Mesorhizobium muleiense]|uniref:Uncharacterized protein n=1 Tax=Mesorhizobium muleiense TaxID=1004279 RepID=A0A1G9FIH5_9HYPH|nr:hypothetical protein SAMN05428953_12252 [Mesorhizobium muleiense]